MGTVFITGIDGVIGSILRERLSPHATVKGVDFPDDLTEDPRLTERLGEVDTVIHLAREREPPGVPEGRVNPSNVRIDTNVFAAVIEAGVKRLVLASSVHADNFRSTAVNYPLQAPGSYFPATPYGTYKLLAEEVGATLAQRFGFEFVAIRLGGVTRSDSPKSGEGKSATWLSHRDLYGAFAACLADAPVPGRTTVFYAVSANAESIHDTINPFGWEPVDDSAHVKAR